MGGDTGGDDLLGDLGGDTDTPDTPEDDAEPGPLLAEPEAGEEPPGQRDDLSKDARKHGAMNRHMQSLGGTYGLGGSKRLFKGGSELGLLAKGRITTGESIENREDAIILETQHEIKKLIAQLEQKHENKTQ